MLTLDKIYHAAYVLKPVARKTDVIYAAKLSQGYDLYLKTENLQLTGSFKLRGAYYKISQLNEEQRKAGIIACSAGNHAQGVALAASRMGIKAIVCMPDGAPISRFSTVSNAPSVLYGRSRAITFLSPIVERNNPKSSETIITIPVFRDFLKQSIISAVTAHTMPPLPKNVISGIIVSRNGLRML